MSLHPGFPTITEPKTKTIESKVLTPQNQSELFKAVGKIVNFKTNSWDTFSRPAVYKENDGQSDESINTFVRQNNKYGYARKMVYIILIKTKNIKYGSDFISCSECVGIDFVKPSNRDWKKYEEDVNKLKAEGFWKETGRPMG